jgi:hypothetical protein
MGSSRLVKYRIGLMRPKRVPQTQGIVFGRDDATKSSGDTTTALQKECRVPAKRGTLGVVVLRGFAACSD